MTGSRLLAILHFAAMGLIGATAACTTATPFTDLEFVTHASFFSGEMGINPAVDPHAFVADSGQPAAIGPQNIEHVAGFRPALLTDPEGSPIYNAQGVLLEGFTLGSWLAAGGTVRITPGDGKATIVVSLRGLRPGGVYSLFENHFDEKPVGFTPLDGSGTSNSFTASSEGTATVTVTAPHVPTHDNAVLVVYHSDRQTHGTERGSIGVNAHNQVITKIPGGAG